MKLETIGKLYEMGEWWEPLAALGGAVMVCVPFLIYDWFWMRAWRRYLKADRHNWRGIFTRSDAAEEARP